MYKTHRRSLKPNFDKHQFDLEEIREMVQAEVEEPLLRAVLEFTNNNQSQSAQILGLNRGTLRKKLGKYNLL